MSADEKQRTVLSIYHERCEPFNLKELEALASKAGVVQQTVKDVNQSLIDDSLVCCDKIGAANIFWSFPRYSWITVCCRQCCNEVLVKLLMIDKCSIKNWRQS